MRRFDLLLALGCSATTLACGAILGLQEPTVDDTLEGGKDSGGGDAPSGDAPSDGCTGCAQPELVASSTSLGPYAMVVTATDLVFTNTRGNTLASVFKVAKTATNGSPTQLADYGNGYTNPIVSGLPLGLAVQGTDFYTALYSSGGTGAYEAGIDHRPLTGCTQKTLAYYGVNSYAVATSASNAFFSQEDFNTSVYTVQSANLDLTNKKVIATPANEVNGMIFDNGALFYATSDGVFHCTPTTCDAAAITQGQTIDAELLATDANNVYFTSTPFNDVPTIQSVARGGGLPKLITNKPFLPFGVATDGTNVYFTDIGDLTNNTTAGGVYRCPVAGCNGNEELLSNGPAAGDNPRAVVVDAQYVYWGTRGGKIWRLAK